jgi:hypothetical protein
MITIARLILATAVAAIALGVSALAAEPVDLLLVLAADVSRSVDQQKFQLQRDGYAAAVADPRVLEAIRSGPHKRIAICFVEWSGLTAQKLVIDWTVVGDADSARRLGDLIVEAPRAFAERTSISGGIEFSLTQLERAPHDAPRKVIDVSGDGTNNSGRSAADARDEAVAKGVTVNGLVILSDRPVPWNPQHTNPPGGLAKYYEMNVMGGPGAFVMVAQDFKSFGQALINKMVAEIAQRPLPERFARIAP